MNANGISVFYGALNEDTAIAEIRPPVGSFVVTSSFKPLCKLVLLNLTEINANLPNGSICDPDYLERCRHHVFLIRFRDRITKPVLPSDESRDYIITQAVADFFSGNKSLELDCILYPSAQSNEKGANNIVLFHKSSRVKRLEDDYCLTHEWWETSDGKEYFSFDKVAKRKISIERPIQSNISDLWEEKVKGIKTPRDVLRIDVSSIKFFKIAAVCFRRELYFP